MNEAILLDQADGTAEIEFPTPYLTATGFVQAFSDESATPVRSLGAGADAGMDVVSYGSIANCRPTAGILLA